MAISPLTSTGTVRLAGITSRLNSDQVKSSESDMKASVTDISNTDNSIINARNSSLLYQVVDTILDTDETQSTPSSSNQVYNRLLTASLADNEQFISSLGDLEA